ncbi:ABC-2 family transporter protein, partial [Rhizoctonia solani]
MGCGGAVPRVTHAVESAKYGRSIHKFDRRKPCSRGVSIISPQAAMMLKVFWRQFRTLVRKNWIVVSNHWFMFFVADWYVIWTTSPLGLRFDWWSAAFAIFFAYASEFLNRPDKLGFGTAVDIPLLGDVWTSDTIYYVDNTGYSDSRVPALISALTQYSNLSPAQQSRLKQLASPNDVQRACKSNFNMISECFAVIIFDYVPYNPQDRSPLSYTIRADSGRTRVDVENNNSDTEKVLLPVQWAVDRAGMELMGVMGVETPREWPYTQETNEEQALKRRLSYADTIEDLLVFVLFVVFLGIVYQLAGAVVDERASKLASLMHVMGCGRAARIVSWHISISMVYLPAWIITAVIWQRRIFSATNVGLIIAIHIITGLSLSSFSLLASMPFHKSPQLAAISTTFLSLLLAIIAMLLPDSPTACGMYTLIFPPGFYVFAIKAVSRFETREQGAVVGSNNGFRVGGDEGLVDGRILGVVIGVAVANIFLWAHIAGVVERSMFEPGAGERDASTTSSGFFGFLRKRKPAQSTNEGAAPPVLASMTNGAHPVPAAITLHNITKTFKPAKRRAERITAVKNLSLSVPSRGIFVLLGANGSGKSTTLGMVAGLEKPDSGWIEFNDQPEAQVDEKGKDLEKGDETDLEKATSSSGGRKASLGLVPQKNVLFPELTCQQTLRLWRDLKAARFPDEANNDSGIDELIKSCSLEGKTHARASTLSGGQKRRLQLAAGLIGGSKIVLVDEATSGVDPLSRRAIWRALRDVRNDRCVVFTTHFLDEADLLADDIAILAAPGKLLAQGSPVSLKSRLGEGYVVTVSTDASPGSVLDVIRTRAPHAAQDPSDQGAYVLHTKSASVVGQVLDALESKKKELGIDGYDVRGTSMEAIFLGLMGTTDTEEVIEHDELAAVQSKDGANPELGRRLSRTGLYPSDAAPLPLSDGRKTSPLRQALTGFHKRCLILRRSWLTYALMVIIALAGACVPLIFLKDRSDTCSFEQDMEFVQPLYIPSEVSSLPSGAGAMLNAYRPLIAPPGLLDTLGSQAESIPQTQIQTSEFESTLRQNYRNLSLGGLAVSSGVATVAWEASSGSKAGMALLNLANNVLVHQSLGSGADGTGGRIMAAFQNLPGAWVAGTGAALKWEGFFGASMGLWPAFFVLYVSAERRSSVQAMQLSNGMTPAGLWLGHLLFDFPWVVVISTIVTIIFAAVTSQFYALGVLWVVMVLYGVAGALFAYVISTFVKSPLAAFAIAGGYNVIISVLYTAAYMLTLTYSPASQSERNLQIVHYTIALISPVVSLVRAGFVSVNLFSILCDGFGNYSPSSPGSMSKFGGPIVYLIGWILLLFGLLMWIEYGKPIPKQLRFKRKALKDHQDIEDSPRGNASFVNEVKGEAERVQQSDDALRVLNVSKVFPGRFTAVDDVSFGVDNETFAMLGPNGAGKTTTFNIIRGDIRPTKGDVRINGVSIVDEPAAARVSLGVTPQFSAADSQLTVREHMMIYGSIKGLHGEELKRNVDMLIEAATLSQYGDRLASKLSGGNARKLSLALALIGNPRVLLIDEYSTGIDAATKRAMWKTLRRVSAGKAVVITTHSMEEASALASKVGILSGRMLAVGTMQSLVSHFPTYEVHFTARTPAEAARAQELMTRFPGAKQADDVATRYEVPIGQTSLADLFRTLSGGTDKNDDSIQEADADLEYTVERLGLESVFLKVIREHERTKLRPEKRSGWKWW